MILVFNYSYIALKSSLTSRFAGTNNRSTVHTIPVIHGLVFLIKSTFKKNWNLKIKKKGKSREKKSNKYNSELVAK